MLQLGYKAILCMPMNNIPVRFINSRLCNFISVWFLLFDFTHNWILAYSKLSICIWNYWPFSLFFQICVVSIVVYSWLRSNYKYCQNIPKYVDQIRKCVTICVPSQTTNELISNVLLPYLFLSEIDLLSEHIVSARKFYQKIIKISLWANKLSVWFDELCYFKTCAIVKNLSVL